MKALLVGGSVIANIVLATSLVLRPSLAPPSVRDFIAEHVRSSDTATTQAVAKASVAAKAKPKLWSQLDTDDLPALIARLRNAGFPPAVIRGIISSLVDARYADKIRELNQPDPNVPFWRRNSNGFMMDGRYVELNRLYREQSKTLRDLLGKQDWSDAGDITADQRRRFGNLSTAKIDLVQRVEDDYREMTEAIRGGMRGIELAEDREKLALLAKEKQSDLLGILTPEELAEYEMRTSRLTESLRSRLATFDATESEFKAIYDLYRAAGEKVTAAGGFRGLDQKTREEVQTQLNEQARAALGEARYNDLLKSVDAEYQTVTRLTQQQNLAGTTTDQVMAIRARTLDESKRIAEDPGMAAADKRSALKTLADNTRVQLTGLLGSDGTQAYVRTAPWLTMIGSGMGASLQPALPVIVADGAGGITYMSMGSLARSIPVRRPNE